MSTHRGTWKQRERVAAGMFGTKRQYGSGSGGRADETRSDSKHERLFIECKLRERHAVLTLWRDTKALATKEGKTPLIMLSEKGKTGQWLMCHTSDLDTIIVERLLAMEPEERDGIMTRLWAAQEI